MVIFLVITNYITISISNQNLIPLHEKCPYSEFFWSVFSRTRTAYGDLLCISPYSIQMRTRKTLEKDTFYEIQTSCEILHVKSYVIFEFQFKDQEKEMIYYCKSTRKIPSQLRESVVLKIVEEFQMFVSVKQFRFEILLKSIFGTTLF